MARSPIPDLIERFHQMSPEERACFLDLVDPQPEPEPTAKQTRKRRGRSSRAQSLSNAIARTPRADADSEPAKTPETAAPICGTCGHPEDYQDHFQPSPDFHEFQAPKGKKKLAAVQGSSAA